uniref:DM13 domain-containing protein n=1 Tax=Meloidogyne hapla TaxID=6305 RepID=A0A1I8BWN7_MELHA
MKTEAFNKNENGSEKVAAVKNNNESVNLLAEREEEEEDERIIATNTTNNTKRDRRNLYNEIFGNKSEENNENISNAVDFDKQEDEVKIIEKYEKIEIKENINNSTLPLTVEAKSENGSFHLNLNKNEENEKERNIDNNKTIIINQQEQLAHPSNETYNNKIENQQEIIKNLKLFQHQTLLLTLPPERLTKLLDWLSIWEHGENKNKEALATVLMPKNNQIPSIVQIRVFPSPAIGINGVKMLQSGPINVLDTKTIEVTEFTFHTEDLPAWFMVGKEIMPNAKGHIVPIFDKKNKTFNCDSLREYHNETVTLRLPDPFDIKDVFWFANDMLLPPDLLNLQVI